jgi:hypothetical protein
MSTELDQYTSAIMYSKANMLKSLSSKQLVHWVFLFSMEEVSQEPSDYQQDWEHGFPVYHVLQLSPQMFLKDLIELGKLYSTKSNTKPLIGAPPNSAGQLLAANYEFMGAINTGWFGHNWKRDVTLHLVGTVLELAHIQFYSRKTLRMDSATGQFQGFLQGFVARHCKETAHIHEGPAQQFSFPNRINATAPCTLPVWTGFSNFKAPRAMVSLQNSYHVAMKDYTTIIKAVESSPTFSASTYFLGKEAENKIILAASKIVDKLDLLMQTLTKIKFQKIVDVGKLQEHNLSAVTAL